MAQTIDRVATYDFNNNYWYDDDIVEQPAEKIPKIIQIAAIPDWLYALYDDGKVVYRPYNSCNSWVNTIEEIKF